MFGAGGSFGFSSGGASSFGSSGFSFGGGVGGSSSGSIFGGSSSGFSFGGASSSFGGSTLGGSTVASNTGFAFGGTNSMGQSLGAMSGGFGGITSCVGTSTYDRTTEKTNTGQSTNFKFTHICCMDSYKDKPLALLRYEDYKKQSGAPSQSSGFGASTSTPSSFGGGSGFSFGSPSSAPGGFAMSGSSSGFSFGGGGGFGASSTSSGGGFSFGSSASTGFGFSSGGGFGSSSSSGGFGFGSGSGLSSGTGAGFGFGGGGGGGGFGSPAPSSGGFGFGASSGSSGGFGFGGSSTSTGSGFSFGSGFGSSTGSSGFGTGGSGFSFGGAGGGGGGGGANTGFSFGGGSGGGFGASSSSGNSGFSFGSQSSAGSGTFGFGSSTSSSGFSFGSSASTGMAFGTGGSGNTGFSFGGSTAPSSGGSWGFGGSTSASSGFSFGGGASTGFSVGSSFGGSSTGSPSWGGFGNQPQPQQQNLPEPSLTENAYGKLPKFEYKVPTAKNTPQKPKQTSRTPATTGSMIRHYSRFNKLAPRPEKPTLQLDYAPTDVEKEHAFTSNFLVTQPRLKKLVVETDNPLVSPLFNREARKKLMTAQREDDKKEGALGPPSTPYILKSGKVKAIPQPDFSDAADSQIAGSPLSTPLRHDGVARPTPKKTPQQHSAYVDAFYTQESGLSVNTKVPIPKCTRQGVYTIPSSSSLQKMSEDQLKAVPNFTVKKDGCGAIQFLDPVDVRGLDIDSIIEFTQHSIAVYPNEDHKPEPGRGLNVPAVISLERCWPLDPITNRPSTDDEELSRFAKRLKKKCGRQGSQFRSYNKQTGEWIFEVQGF